MKVLKQVVTIECESRDERRLLSDAIDMVHDLGDPALVGIVRELRMQQEALTRKDGTGTISVSRAALAQLICSLDLQADWARENANEPVNEGAEEAHQDLDDLEDMMDVLNLA